MNQSSKKILIADDSSFMRKLFESALGAEGYEVISAASGEEALELLTQLKPDLILLDGVMTGISGYEVLTQLRSDFRFNLTPIIMITGQSDNEDKFKGLEMGADDYIVKPFQNRELIARVRNTLVRLERNRGANPLTGLRGNNDIEAEISTRLASEEAFTVMYLDLNSFKAYNDIYGFANGDIAIKLSADIIASASIELGTKRDLVGHIGGDDFVLITEPQCAEAIAKRVVEEFDVKILDLYTKEDQERGYITSKDRMGNTMNFGFIGMSIANVNTRGHEILSALHLAEVAAEYKKKAKAAADGKSAYVSREMPE